MSTVAPPKVGDVFGRLTCVELIPRHKGDRGLWIQCLCECGAYHAVRVGALRRGAKSCGCKSSPKVQIQVTKDIVSHNSSSGLPPQQTHGRTGDETHKAWNGIPRKASEAILEWVTFDTFLADMGERPEGFFLIRMDETKRFGPTNCKWVDNDERKVIRAAHRKRKAGGRT